MKRLLIAIMCCLLTSVAAAQTGTRQSATALNTEIATNQASNQRMTALQLRQTLVDMVASTVINNKDVVWPSGGVPGPTVSAIWITQTSSGTCSNATGCPLNRSTISSDTTSGGTNNMLGWQFTYNFGGPTATGNRIGLSSQLILTAPSGNNFGATGEGSYAALTASTTANTGDNGTGLTSATASGQIQSANIIARAQAGATNLWQVSPIELNTEVKATSSTYEKVGLAIVDMFDSAVQGTVVDAALEIANQVGAVGWRIGIQLGSPHGAWPLDTAGTVMACSETGSCGTAAYGIDLTKATFTGAGLAFALSTPASSAAACKTGSMRWDASFIYVCTATNTWKRATLNAF